MSLQGGLGVLLVLFALSLLFMQAALRWGRSTGLFAALPWGMLPLLFLAVSYFGALQQVDDPEVKAQRLQYQTEVERMAAQVYPKPEQNAERDALRSQWSKVIEVAPALMFSLLLGILAPLAVHVRWRATRNGSMVPPQRLSHWTAPWPLTWLILVPIFLIVAEDRAGLTLGSVWLKLAWNILVVGLAVFLFQGLLVMAAKLRAWSRDPNTRALVFLTLALVFTSFLLGDVRGLLVALLVMGIFEPWLDLRRLNPPPTESTDRT